MSESPQEEPKALVIDLGAPDRSDGQPVCASPSIPLPLTPTLYLRLECSLLDEHEGPHLWSWAWQDLDEQQEASGG